MQTIVLIALSVEPHSVCVPEVHRHRAPCQCAAISRRREKGSETGKRWPQTALVADGAETSCMFSMPCITRYSSSLQHRSILSRSQFAMTANPVVNPRWHDPQESYSYSVALPTFRTPSHPPNKPFFLTQTLRSIRPILELIHSLALVSSLLTWVKRSGKSCSPPRRP